MTSIYVVTVETEHFTFQAADVTAIKARAAMRRALQKHGRENNLPRAWYKDYDLSSRRLVLGAGYRDDYRLTEPERREAHEHYAEA